MISTRFRADIGRKLWVTLLAGSIAACGVDHPDGAEAFVRVAADAGGHCLLVLEPTGTEVVTGADATDPAPRPGPAVLDGQGRLYTQSYEDGVVARWTPDGRFDGTVGAFGDGPGEFHRIEGMALGAGDSVHVFHRGRWSIIAPDLSLVPAARSAHLVSGGALAAEVLDDGRLLVPAISSRVGGPVVAVLSRSGVVEAELGAGRFGTGVLTTDFGVAYPGQGDSFWVGPVDWWPTGYVVEKWNVDGEVLDRIERQIDWISAEAVEESSWPVRFSLRQHRGGLLHVTAQIPDPEGDASGLPPGIEPTLGRFEFLDPHSGTLVTSGWQGDHEASVGTMWGRLSNTGHTFRFETRGDERALVMLRMVLQPLPDGPGSECEDPAR